MPRCSVNFRKASKKTLLVESFLDKRAWNVTKRRTLSPAFPIFGYFWEWMTFDSFFRQGRLLLMYFHFSPKLFLSADSFCDVTWNINKKISAIALLEPTPYRISMPVSFLQYLPHHFQWFTQAESTTGLTKFGYLQKLYTRFHVQEKPIQLVKFFNLYLKILSR